MAKREKFDPRAIPHRDHYDRLMTWATSVIGRQDAETLEELQKELVSDAKEVCGGTDDYEKIKAVLSELGFAAVLDNMADIIEQRENEHGKA